MTDPYLQLEEIKSADDFTYRLEAIVDAWTEGGLGLEAVDPVLRFMEAHPQLDYGVPGPLVHFMERFHRKGYEGRLIASIRRRPTMHTVWMLNRLINGTSETSTKQSYLLELEQAKHNPNIDNETRVSVEDFISTGST